MQLVSTTPNLVGLTKKFAEGSTANPTTLHTTAEIKEAINDAYQQLREIARVYGEGYEYKRTYATTVADQLWYQIPSDCKRVITVEVDASGLNISSNSAASPILLEPKAYDVGMELADSASVTSPKYTAIGDDHVAVIKPVATGGASALRIAYEADTADLTGDTDEPVLPKTFHRLICKLAAITLRTAVDWPVRDLESLTGLQLRQYKIWAQERLYDPEGQISVAGLIDQSTNVQHGFYKKTT